MSAWPIKELFAKFSENKVFSQLDLSDAYFHMILSKESRPLTTINTHKGLFMFSRLLFGIKTAPSQFQRTMDQCLAGVSGVLVYLDDVLIMAPTQEEHDTRLLAVLTRLQEWGFRLRLEKCEFNAPMVKYLGSIVDN